MRTTFRATTALMLVVAIASCGFLKKKTDEEATDAAASAAAPEPVVDAAPQAPQAPSASNEGDVARFPDETKIDSVASAVQRTATVREAPPAGKSVATLTKGMAVTQIAQREKYFLVTFDKPGDASIKLMGWLHQDAFTAVSVDAGLKTLVCTAPDVPLFSDVPFCGRTCAKDADCGAGQACKGTAQTFTAGKIGANASVCTVFKPNDAGAPPPVIDAGPGVDAGAAVNAFSDEVPASAQKTCTLGYAFVAKDGKCHRLCPVAAACVSTRTCIRCDGRPVCSSNPNLCK